MIPKFFIHNSESPFDPELFVQPKNTREVWRNKPCGGIWLAAYTSKKSYLSHWHQWCDQENVQLKTRNFLYTLVDDSKENYDELIKRYPIEYYNPLDLFPLTNFIDFEAMMQDWEGMFLSQRGLEEMTLDIGTSNLRSWDISCLLVFNPKILELVNEF